MWRWVGAESGHSSRNKRFLSDHVSGQEIVIRNARDQEVEVIIAGDLPPGWQMLSESHPHEKESASRVLWRLTVAPKGKNTLSYKVRIKQ